ncbi:MAG: FAD-dependent oxidoreductase [Verrucomicrobia bacterium]|nr:FAD-dependent oxidoreductase [Verrucomicrobiota bacterium]MCH8513222.1 FAD-dependent oxidoreductase [Kiritimatiellia bacterium]
MPIDTQSLRILSHEPMGRDAFLLRLERPDWSWRAGELVGILGATAVDQRDYTIASGERDDTLDVIYRLIPHGVLTPFLRKKAPGDTLRVLGPYGRFVLRDPNRPVLFCATGTGIAPCRAYLRTHPTLDLTLLHGVRHPEDLYFREEFERSQYHPHCSRTRLAGATERITDTLKTMELPDGVHVYLCGANEMIYEADEILSERGVGFDQIFHEPYYYRAGD